MTRSFATSNHNLSSLTSQRGAVLVIGLMILLLMTMIGITGMSRTNLEERMAGNSLDHSISFNAAEVALKEGEDFVESLSVLSGFSETGANGLFSDQSGSVRVWETVNWRDTSAVIETSRSVAGTAIKPRYIVEHLTQLVSASDTLNMDNYGQGTGAGNIEMFRITAASSGSSDSSYVMLQSTYGKRL